MDNLITLVLSLEVVTFFIAGTMGIIPSRMIFWTPFTLVHVPMLLFGVNTIVDAPAANLWEKTTSVALLIAFQILYILLWRRVDRKRTREMIEHHRRQSEWHN